MKSSGHFYESYSGTKSGGLFHKCYLEINCSRDFCEHYSEINSCGLFHEYYSEMNRNGLLCKRCFIKYIFILEQQYKVMYTNKTCPQGTLDKDYLDMPHGKGSTR
jgi:hypothetical protein